MSGVKVNSLVKAYLAIRLERDKLAKKYQQEDSELKDQISRLESAMLETCDDIGAETLRTESGTIIKTLKENYICGDWDNFKTYVLENQALELLQQRISQTNFKEFLSTREEEGLPPGISTMREFKITVRKPTSK
jgi:hypothetical protein|tara:strand:- start:552 stop:956 length:405 start_codon:yes stop_codon:yes gene_type:complete